MVREVREVGQLGQLGVVSEHGRSPLLPLLHCPGGDVLGRLGDGAVAVAVSLLRQRGAEGAVGLEALVRHLTGSLTGPRARPPSDSDPHWRPRSLGHVLDSALDVGGIIQVDLLHVGLDLCHFVL